MYILHLLCAQGIFSHESARYFHALTVLKPSECFMLK